MNPPAPGANVPVAGAADERVEVANLAARVAALPSNADEAAGRSSRTAQGGDSRRPSRWTRLLLGIAWLMTLGLGACVLLRLFFHDATNVLTWINAFTRYVYLPAYGCLLLALWRRRRWRWLAVANVGIIVCHLWWLAPDFLRDRRFVPSTTAGSSVAAPQSLRIYFANVRNRNDQRGALWHEIQEADPDIVILVECMGDWRESFRQSPLASAYSYNSGLELNQGIVDNFVFAKSPPMSFHRDWIAGRCVETMEFPLGSDMLHVVGLHAPAPMHFRDDDYAGYWNRVLPMLLQERHPLVVVGDFNATQYSKVCGELKASGLRSAHEDRARGYATTWPNGTLPIPPIRIDQAFLSPEVKCLDIAEGRGTGSDHKPLILDIEIGL